MNEYYLKEPFNSILSKRPVVFKDGIPYYGSEHEGDQFNEDDVHSWTKGGRFVRRWQNKGVKDEYRNMIYMDLCKKIESLNLPILDIASGPGLGLIPDIYSINQNIQVLATDGCPILVEKWNDFFKQNIGDIDIQFASFNVNDMPIHDDSVDVITSNRGFSSLRYAGADQMLGIKESYRILKSGGYVFTIENEFEDKSIIQKVFDLWGKENWFKNDKSAWRERFEKAGFITEFEKIHFRRIEKDDWELGEMATKFGLEIVVISKAFILKKP
jgi:ubiquinone/menaquinone biosynthesis C-methylase UbiE